MIQYIMQVAGRVVAVSAFYETTLKYCNGFLSKAEPEFSVEIFPEDIEFERCAVNREYALENFSDRKIDDSLLERTALQRKIAEKLFEYDTLLFHGSVIAVDGEGYLFTAKSGTGKSTHTRLWREMLGDRAVMVNDDKPFLVVKEEGILACGSPWNGKHRLGSNVDVPLKAICILERGDHNEICQVPANEAVYMLLQQSNRPQQPNLLVKYMELLERIAKMTNFYRLKCNMEPDAAMVSYQAMSGSTKEN